MFFLAACMQHHYVMGVVQSLSPCLLWACYAHAFHFQRLCLRILPSHCSCNPVPQLQLNALASLSTVLACRSSSRAKSRAFYHADFDHMQISGHSIMHILITCKVQCILSCRSQSHARFNALYHADPSHMQSSMHSIMQIPVTCKVQGRAQKTGIFHSGQLRTECVDTDCKECEGKTGEDRMMRCSGRFSFEEHCGRPTGQKYWKQGFKVQVKGMLEIHSFKVQLVCI